MSFIRNRILNSVSSLIGSIRTSKGGVLIGKTTAGAGFAQEIDIDEVATLIGAATIGDLTTIPATVTLDPTGANNEILVTAKDGGTAGNSLTAEIAIDSVTDRTGLTVVEAAGGVVVTSGDKRRMIVTGTLDPDLSGVYDYEGEVNGRASYKRGVAGPLVSWNFVTWGISLAGSRRFTASGDTPFPDGADWSSSAIAPATGTPTVTASPATAAQAVALSQSALSVTLANATGSDGSGALAAVAETSLAGGSNTITPESIGAETPAGAQAKVDALKSLDMVYTYDMPFADILAAEVDYVQQNFTLEAYPAADAAGAGPIHPSIIRFKKPWNGYLFWMGHTPYPNADWENPSIAVSNDGLTWIDPPGVSNPIVPYPGAGKYNSDVYMLFADGYLYCTYRERNTAGGEIIKYRRSTDGVDWTDEGVIVDSSPDFLGRSNISHSIIAEADGTFTMFAVDIFHGNGAPAVYPSKVVKWSAPEITGPWSVDGACDFSPVLSGYQIWHLGARRNGQGYGANILQNTSGSAAPGFNYLAVSDDGLTWTVAPRALNTGATLLGTASSTWYKSDFLPVLDRGKPSILLAMGSLGNMRMASASLIKSKYQRGQDLLAGNDLRQSRILNDTFIRANGAVGNASSGQTWDTAWTGGTNFIISSNRLGLTASTNTKMAINAGRLDVAISLRVAAVGTQSTGIIFRGTSNADHYRLLILTNGNWIAQNQAGASLAPTKSPKVLQAGDWIRVETKGNNARFFHNGVCQFEITLTGSALTGTFVGITAVNNDQFFDGFMVDAI